MLRAFAKLILLLFISPTMLAAETTYFPAEDGVTITGETGGSGNIAIVLFHMAGASRGEYLDIAPRLHEMGYRTLAIDQRSGGSFNNVENETAARVPGQVSYIGAAPDLKAATAFAKKDMGAQAVAVVGSSYSASLVLVLAGQNEDFADAVIAFSPGEYFSDRSLVKDSASEIQVPVFLTAARSEMAQVKAITDVIPSSTTTFTPQGPGRHGATALVSADGAEYWAALEAFLAEYLPLR